MSAHLDAKEIKRTFEDGRGVKALSLFFAVLVAFAIVYLVFLFVRWFTGWDELSIWTWTIGVVLWFFLSKARYYMVSIPEISGLVTIDLLPWTLEENKLRAYPTGLHLRWPWEQVKEGNFINLRTMTTDVVEEDFPTKAGPMMHVAWSAQYEPQWYTIPIYISIAEQTINSGLIDVSSETLKDEIWKIEEKDLEMATGRRDELAKKIMDSYKTNRTVPVKLPDGKEANVSREEYYGVVITLAPISDYDFEKSYQQARAVNQRVVGLKKASKEILKDNDGSITSKDAWTDTLMLDGQNVKREVSEQVKRLDVTPAAAKTVELAAAAFGKALSGARGSS
ncbi:MAG: hypothetical protein Q8Q36_02810 [bacterium]|nr:hypothetical protein [bacterium]